MKLKIPSFRDASVLVIGDVMLDRYWYGKTGRVSQEAPVPIVDIESSEDRPGGAANVALNLLFVLGFGMDVAGLALATAITAWGNLFLLAPALRGRLGLPASAPDFTPRILRVSAAAAASVLLARGAFELLGGDRHPTRALLASIALAIGLFAASAHLLSIPEWTQVRARFPGLGRRP